MNGRGFKMGILLLLAVLFTALTVVGTDYPFDRAVIRISETRLKVHPASLKASLAEAKATRVKGRYSHLPQWDPLLEMQIADDVSLGRMADEIGVLTIGMSQIHYFFGEHEYTYAATMAGMQRAPCDNEITARFVFDAKTSSWIQMLPHTEKPKHISAEQFAAYLDKVLSDASVERMDLELKLHHSLSWALVSPILDRLEEELVTDFECRGLSILRQEYDIIDSDYVIVAIQDIVNR